ncbi:MAG: PilZ domain-containing protein [Pseudomonadota bacterium]|jgi:hypothetical protein|nr:PilZ domain-containing protein [Pseudomonadota bacterium]
MKPKIHLPELTDNGRRAYRLKVNQDDPIWLEIEGRSVHLEDLSETGVAFFSPQPLSLGSYPVRLKFQIDDRAFSFDCALKLVRKVGNLWCGDLSGLSDFEHRMLSQFVTWCQARAIRHDKMKPQ